MSKYKQGLFALLIVFMDVSMLYLTIPESHTMFSVIGYCLLLPKMAEWVRGFIEGGSDYEDGIEVTKTEILSNPYCTSERIFAYAVCVMVLGMMLAVIYSAFNGTESLGI